MFHPPSPASNHFLGVHLPNISSYFESMLWVVTFKVSWITQKEISGSSGKPIVVYPSSMTYGFLFSIVFTNIFSSAVAWDRPSSYLIKSDFCLRLGSRRHQTCQVSHGFYCSIGQQVRKCCLDVLMLKQN